MQENQFWNQFETYLHDHRDELDVDEPRAAVWDQIARQLPREARPLWQQSQVWRMAAVIAIALGLSYWWYARFDSNLPQIGADMGNDHAQGQTTWDDVPVPYAAEIDSLSQVAGAKTDNFPELQQAEARTDSLQSAGAPTPDRLKSYEQFQAQKVQLLRSVTQ
jgi:hypothetical protein